LVEVLATFSPQVSLLVSRFQGANDLGELLRVFRANSRLSPVIAVADTGKPCRISDALAQGASDFLIPPFQPMDVLLRIGRLVEPTRPEGGSIQSLKEKLRLQQFVGESPLLMREIEKIPTMADCDVNVLIEGETGTGKEIYAKAIHDRSRRSGGPFIALNCASIPVDLAENEFFGHASGAFTGATSSKPGVIHDADGGTLFLDEIDSLSTRVQPKLLRFLQDQAFRPLGSTEICQVHVRIIAATNTDLEEAIRAGRFRRDLFYRLNVVTVSLPPLRDRTEDIPLLCRHFLDQYSAKFHKECKGITAVAMQKLLFYRWPGNVRELENVIAGAVALSTDTEIRSDEIRLPLPELDVPFETFQIAKRKVLWRFEHDYLTSVLARCGNLTKAAQAAGKHPRAMWELLRKHNLKTGREHLSA